MGHRGVRSHSRGVDARNRRISYGAEATRIGGSDRGGKKHGSCKSRSIILLKLRCPVDEKVDGKIERRAVRSPARRAQAPSPILSDRTTTLLAEQP